MIKYQYNGIPLTEYCQKNYICYQTLLQRIHKLQILNVGISDDEVVRLAIENNVHGNTKYKCQGVPLGEYCQNNDINYQTILQRIYKFKKLNPNLSTEELIELAVDNNFTGVKYNKYKYNGIKLREYCQNNDINYSALLQRIQKIKRLNDGISDDEAIKIAMEHSINGNTKYKCEGVSLREYCQKNGLNYSTLLQRIYRLQISNVGVSTEEIVKIAFEDRINGNAKYVYQGVSLRTYCQKNNISYSVIRGMICKIQRSDASISNEEAVRLAIEENANCQRHGLVLTKKYQKSK